MNRSFAIIEPYLGEDARADAPHGPRHHACGIDLPARDGRADREIADALQFRIERELKEMGPIEGPGLAVDRSSLGLSPRKE
jgi:hypothetical protein